MKHRNVSMLFAAAVLFIGAAVNVAHGQRIGKNVDVAFHKPKAQSETSVAVDPTNNSHILVSSNDYDETTVPSTTRVYQSIDSGATFQETHLAPTGTCTDGWVSFGADGTAFVAYDCLEGGTTTQRIAYRIGQDPWTHITIDPNLAGVTPDRDMVAVDTGGVSPFYDSVYIGYDDAGTNQAPRWAPYVLYSRHGAQNWHRSTPSTGLFAIGVNVSVAGDGTVYATWEDFVRGNILVVKSTDVGVSWGTPNVVTHYRISTFVGGSYRLLIPPRNVRGIVPFPMSGVSPIGGLQAGRLYSAYTDEDLVLDGSTSIYVRYSDDGGMTWSAECKVNDDTVHAYHFQPAIAVAPDGFVGVSFYDTRRDPQNKKKTDQFISFSYDGGMTWTANSRVTEDQSDETFPMPIKTSTANIRGWQRTRWARSDSPGLTLV